MALRLKTNIVSFKNRLKTRVALIELLDLSGIAVGNVGVPTCSKLERLGATHLDGRYKIPSKVQSLPGIALVTIQFDENFQ
jgi:hypothetical protein